MQKNSFCSIPWIHAATKTNGTSRVCCLMSNHDSGNGGLTGHSFKTHTIEEIHNSEFTRNIRKQFLAGEKPAECNTCWVKEDNGGQSRRMFTNKMYKDVFDYNKALQLTSADGSTTQMPIYWDLRFGNLCNLKCVMCGPQSSSMWYKDWAKVHSTDHFYDSGTKINMSDGSKQNRKDRESDYDWWESEHFWEQLDTHKEQLQHVYLVGGEPMLVEPHYKFLQKLIDSGISKNVVLEYDTNITNVHQRAIDQWKHFKKLMLRVSIDDFGEQNDYIRFPSKWYKLDENIKRIEELLPNTQIEISITWQVLNAFTFLKLLDHFKKYHINIRILSSPRMLDCKQLSKQSKLDLINIYENSVHRSKIQHLINYLKMTMEYEGNIYECADFLERLDVLRKTSWQNTFKDLFKSINT
jgi:organic radical activating enzyme